MLKILKYFKWWEWLWVLVIFGLLGLQVYCSLSLPEFMGDIVAGIYSVYFGMSKISDLIVIGLKMLGVIFGEILCTIVVSYIAAYIITSLCARVREDIFKKVNSFSMSEINNFSIPSLITRSTNDVTQIQQVLVILLRMGLLAPITFVGAIIKIIGKSNQLSLITVFSVLALVILITVMIVFVVPKFKILQKNTDNINLVTRENLTGLRVVRANNAEQHQEEKFENVNKRLTKTNLFVNRVTSIMGPGMSLVFSGTSLAIVWFSAHLINNGTITPDIMTSFTSYAMQVITSFMFLSLLFIMIPRGQVCANRINKVLESKNSIIDGEGVGETKLKGQVEFRNVSFKYPDAEGYILKNISFKAEQGETVAFIGSTGSGKSTLINLIPRFYDATEGEILIDGENIKNYKIEELNNILGYVPQKGVLFSGSIRENIKYGNQNATDEDVEKALKVACAEFVNKLPEKLDYRISQGGKNVSGGQKQRLSIARAVAKNPEIYIFDDSFSALDYKTDKELRKRLKKHTKNATSLIVAQRIGTIRNADKIIVLNDGEMVGYGKHEELIENCEIYKEIALSQLSKEEL